MQVTIVGLLESGSWSRTTYFPRQPQQEDPWKGESQPSDRTRDWVLKQKVSDVLTADSGADSPEAPAGGTTPAESQHVAAIVNRLQLIATKIRSMVNRCVGKDALANDDW